MEFQFYREQVLVSKTIGQIGTPDHGKITENFADGDWRWKLMSKGRNVANGGEGYKRIGDMLRSLRTHYGHSPQRVKNLEKALHEYEEKYGKLSKPFDFSANLHD